LARGTQYLWGFLDPIRVDIAFDSCLCTPGAGRQSETL